MVYLDAMPRQLSKAGDELNYFRSSSEYDIVSSTDVSNSPIMVCRTCGRRYEEYANYCNTCGTETLGPLAEEISPVYAGFGRRFAAGFADYLLIWILAYSFGLAAKVVPEFRFGEILVLWLGTSLYSAIFHKKWGMTVGKCLFSIRVLQVSLSPVGWRHACLRSLPEILGGLFHSVPTVFALTQFPPALLREFEFGTLAAVLAQFERGSWWGVLGTLLGLWGFSEFIVLLTNRKRRALHDFLAGTVVVHVDQSARGNAPGLFERLNSGAATWLQNVRPHSVGLRGAIVIGISFLQVIGLFLFKDNVSTRYPNGQLELTASYGQKHMGLESIDAYYMNGKKWLEFRNQREKSKTSQFLHYLKIWDEDGKLILDHDKKY